MKVTVRYFALLREAAGVETEEVELAGEPSLKDLLDLLGGRDGSLGNLLRDRPLLCAVNQEYAAREKSLRDGDEVALFPPVSGG
jgi:molybdopterin converting factor subunit 1